MDWQGQAGVRHRCCGVLKLDMLEGCGGQARVTSLLLCGGGGVLLATALLHLLPEVLPPPAY